MERLMPEYNENIIVGIIYNDEFGWYITDKEIWFLDYQKRIDAFKEKGFEIKEEYIDDERKGLLIVDSDNARIFLNRLEKYKTDSKQLRELLNSCRNLNDDSWTYDFRPSLYVNFDTQKLFSLYPDPASYEEYAPSNWEGKYFDFMEIIPCDEKYWIDEEGKNLLKEEKA